MLTMRFCVDLNLSDCYVAVESRDAFERRDLRLWCEPSWVFGRAFHTLKTVSPHGSPGGALRTESPSRKRASIPRPQRMVQSAPTFGISPSEKQILDVVTDHPMIPREHLARWLGVSEGRVSQMMHSLGATWGLVDSRSFGIVRQGLALRRRSLYDRLRAIAEYDYTRRPDTVLILVPSIWEERLTTRFCEERNLRDCYVAVEARDVLERRDLRLWCCTSWVIGSRFFTLEGVASRASPGGGPRTQSPERKRASPPRPERMVQAAPTLGISPSEKRTLDLVTDYPMIPREHLALWLGVSEGRVSQMMRSLINTWGLVERRGKRGDTRYTLSAEGIRYVTHRDRAQLPTTRGI